MGENNTIQSVSSGFIRTIQDLSQYISHQKVLGNSDFILSRVNQEKINRWGRPGKKAPAFFSQGPENASMFFVDSEGSFFNGESGALLVKILNAMKMTPESVFICNASDLSSIHARIKKIRPKMLITLGQRAGQLLLNLSSSLEQFQGKFHSYNGVQVMPTFHPSTLLEQPGLKRKVWEDMQQVMQVSGLSQ
ncbi:MAG: uracil-DNA glycosylase [Desulfobacteraceae bacterium]|nr:uracil-DNA glycosylase [Desulfobacteraceae bacterium]